MRYAHFAKICEKCGKVPNMRKSHIRVFLTCLYEGCIYMCDFYWCNDLCNFFIYFEISSTFADDLWVNAHVQHGETAVQ